MHTEKGAEIICLGDNNADWTKNNGLTSIFKDFAKSSNLAQLIETPTRITECSSSIIDLIFSNSSSIIQSGSIFFGLSNHNLIFGVKKFIRPKVNPKSISFRCFKIFDKNKFLADLINSDWTQFFYSQNVDEATSIFNEIAISDKHAPVRQQKIKGNSVPWINEELLYATRERDYLF